MKDNLIPLATIAIFLIIGVACLFWPYKVQKYYIKNSARGLGKFFNNPFFGLMQTRGYIWSLRIGGILAIGVSFFALWVITK